MTSAEISRENHYAYYCMKKYGPHAETPGHVCVTVGPCVECSKQWLKRCWITVAQEPGEEELT